MLQNDSNTPSIARNRLISVDLLSMLSTDIRKLVLGVHALRTCVAVVITVIRQLVIDFDDKELGDCKPQFVA